ncbi:MAG: hypothetical protein HOG49_00780 [Candidatus Scalindua sp.]|nr:hypothetical protein [Candidatus Scalindua sp.]
MINKLKELTFGNILQLLGMFVIAVLFISGGTSTANDNKAEIVNVKADVEKNADDIEALKDVDSKRDGEVKNIKDDLVYHTDILIAIAEKVDAKVPIKKPSQ